MSFIFLLLDWYQTSHRPLPWRETKEPYSVWLSEIMLQQTRVKQGIEYYFRFKKKFPKLPLLAKADEQEVLSLWQGLGYYSRARNLHYTAKYLVENHKGKFPEYYNDLLKLKGIGSYTAAAIASICFGEKVAAIDGNAYRVYARLFNRQEDISSGKGKKAFFELGNQVILQTNNPGDFNQAIMELGATICLPKQPKCENCPIQSYCESYKQGNQSELPIKLKKVKTVNRSIQYVFVFSDNQFILNKRTEKDIWKNLFDFPLWNELTLKQQKLAVPHPEFQDKHILTHQKLNISYGSFKASKETLKKLVEKNNTWELVSLEEIENYPLPKPIHKFLAAKVYSPALR